MIDIQVEDGALLFDRLQHAADAMETGVVRAAMQTVERAQFDLVQQARDNLRRVGGVDLGGTYQNIVPTAARQAGNEVVGDVRAGGAAAFIEYGRPANSPMPPGGVLLAWMARHSLPRRAEFPIARAIARRGIPARPFMAPAKDAVDRELNQGHIPSLDELVRSVEQMIEV